MHTDLLKLVKTYQAVKELLKTDPTAAKTQALALSSLVHKFYRSEILATSLGQALAELLTATEAKKTQLAVEILDGLLQITQGPNVKSVNFLSPGELVAFIQEAASPEEQLLVELFLIDGPTLLAANTGLHLD